MFWPMVILKNIVQINVMKLKMMNKVNIFGVYLVLYLMETVKMICLMYLVSHCNFSFFFYYVILIYALGYNAEQVQSKLLNCFYANYKDNDVKKDLSRVSKIYVLSWLNFLVLFLFLTNICFSFRKSFFFYC